MDKIQCQKCKKFLFSYEFNKNASAKNGCSGYCKKCSKQIAKDYYHINRLKILKRCKNNLNRKEKVKIYRQNPKSFYYTLYHNGGVDFSRNEFIEWHNKQEKKCDYCDITELNYNLMKLHYMNNCKRLTIDRKNNNSPYSLENIILACPICNMIKSSFFSYEEMKQIGQQFVKPKWEFIFNQFNLTEK